MRLIDADCLDISGNGFKDYDDSSHYIDIINEAPTMASLFDGIGGFPLVFSRVGCKPIWASEIEEFPIAVTKMRFGEK